MSSLNPADIPPHVCSAIDDFVISGELPDGYSERDFEELAIRTDAWQCEQSLAYFVREAWSVVEPSRELQWNWHLDVICAYMEAFESRWISRLIINIPPRCMKSLIVSVFFPVWQWIRQPHHQFLTISHEKALALRDSLKSRNIIESDWFQERWPEIRLSGDQNEKAYYSNGQNGHRNAQGLSGGLTGRGGDSIIIDDPHDADKAQSDAERQNAIEAYDGKVTTRLNDQSTGGICIIMQRLHQSDLAGHVIAKDPDAWTHLVIPMEYDGPRYDAGRDIGRPDLNDPRTVPSREDKRDPYAINGELLWESRFPRKAVRSLRIDLGIYGYSGQMQQQPSPKGGGILKKHWWRKWPKGQPLPACEHIFASWDTAFSTKDHTSTAYSARTDWGIWWDEQTDRYNLLLLDAWWKRVDYPELRALAKEIEVEKQPDRQLIEKKASGQSLIQDLRRAGIRVYPYTPDRDKIARAYAVQPMLEAGQIWYPEGYRWAEQVIESVATFPSGAPPSADLTDTLTQALLYLRNNWWISEHPDDIEEDSDEEDQRTALPSFIR